MQPGEIEPILYGKKLIGTIGIMAGIPFVHKEFMWSFAQMIAYNQEFICQPNEYIHLIKPGFSEHASARNSLVDNAFGEWLFMLDCDHQFDPDILARLLRIMNKYDLPVVCGLYQFREEPHPAVLFTHGPRPEKPFELIDFNIKDFPRDKEIMQIASAGAGCLLVKTSVFERIKAELGEKAFSHKPPFSEDHSFFLRLKELQIPVFCAPWVECHHIHHVKLRIEDHDNSDIKYMERREVDIPIL